MTESSSSSSVSRYHGPELDKRQFAVEPWDITIVTYQENADINLLAHVNKDHNLDCLPDRLKQMVGLMQAGDYIQFVKSPPSTWRQLAGRATYELMRGEEMVDCFLAYLN